LRLIWCRSPHVTADMFDLLKVPLLLLRRRRPLCVIVFDINEARPMSDLCSRMHHTRGTTLNRIRPL
jgi:hypothetical protein